MTDKILKSLQSAGFSVQLNYPLKDLTTFKIGGAAKYYLEISQEIQLKKLFPILKKTCLPYFFLGGGSNVLISDKGFKGLVIKNKLLGIGIKNIKGKFKNNEKYQNTIIEVATGETMNRLVRFSLEEKLSGLEEFLGLPGTVGGAIAGNSHFKDKKIKDYLLDCEEFNGFLTKGIFSLKNEDNRGLWKKAEAALEYRKKTQPLDYPSAGCIFKNLNLFQAKKVPLAQGILSAGYLIDQCGLKGLKIGEAAVSKVHANYIVNLASAKSSDVVELIKTIKARVFRKFKVKLEEEIIYLGFFQKWKNI